MTKKATKKVAKATKKLAAKQPTTKKLGRPSKSASKKVAEAVNSTKKSSGRTGPREGSRTSAVAALQVGERLVFHPSAPYSVWSNRMSVTCANVKKQVKGSKFKVYEALAAPTYPRDGAPSFRIHVVERVA